MPIKMCAAILLLANVTYAEQIPTSELPRQQPSSNVDPTYVLGAGDRIVVDVMDAEELVELTGKELQVGSDGYLNVPIIGRVKASGLTIDQIQDVLIKGLRKYVREPRIFINVLAGKSQSVSVIGAVRIPGVQLLEGPKTLAQVLALAGGLSPDAGYQVVITRQQQSGTIPLPDAVLDSSGLYYTADVQARDLTDAKSPKENILMAPGDVITVPRSKLVYVIGEVKKPGGFTLGEHQTISLLQALALAEGMTTTASAGHARVLRRTEGSNVRTELPVDLKKVSLGKNEDMDLRADDILIVPDNSARSAGIKIAEVALQTISGVVIFRGL